MQLIHCDSLEFETWLAPPQEDFPRPTWTKLFVNGQMISNSIEHADWQNDPMELTVCELCWNAGCTMHGFARIVRLDSQVLWLRSRKELLPEYVQEVFDNSRLIDAPLLMSKQMWDDLADQFAMVPAFEELNPPTQLDMLWLWVETIPTAIHHCMTLSPIDLTELPTLLQRNCLASDPLDLPESISAIQTLIDTATKMDEPMTSLSIDLLSSRSDETIKFYLDAKQFPEWKALTLSQSEFILGNSWVVSKKTADVPNS